MENVIKELHSIVNDDAKAQIESKYPELFPKGLEVGSWYRLKDRLNHVLVFVTNNTLSCGGALTQNVGYGVDYKGRWVDSFNAVCTYPKEFTPATEEEVQSALIAEAKKRGFVKGASFMPLDNHGKCTLKGECFRFEQNKLFASEHITDVIFDNGKWAEIITKKYTMAELESIVGHKFEIV